MNEQERILLELIEHQGRALFTLLYRLTLREHVAEDLMQELFIKLMRHNGLCKADNPSAYVSRTAVNLALDWRRKRRPLTDFDTMQQLSCSDPSPLGRLIQDENIEQILDAVARLNPTARQVIVMRYIQQADTDTIAQQMGKTPGQVRAICFKGLAKLRQWAGSKKIEVPYGWDE